MSTRDRPRRRVRIERRGPFRTTLQRVKEKGGWTYVTLPRHVTPPVTRAWGRTPVEARVDEKAWTTSVWRTKAGEGFLPVPKRIRGEKKEGDAVNVEFSFVDD